MIDIQGKANDKAFLYAYLNASFQSGFENPIDKSITEAANYDLSSYKKMGEIPYDFIRKRLSIQIKHNDQNVLITKGALQNVLSICSHTDIENKIESVQQYKETINKLYNDRSADGFRVLGIAYKILNKDEKLTREDEVDMVFLGFLLLFDPPKKDIIQTIQKLSDLGVSLKIITGDNKFVAESIGKQIGLINPRIISGSNIRLMSDEALLNAVNKVDVFAEIEPNQKERIILALKKAGNIVGYMGDGINDASALHSADVGISVESAVDVAKESADIVLLETDLNVLINGVNEGRKTFANTMKYIFMATSANFGNMFSMAGVSLILPFLPLLPKQILLTNLLTDFPEITIASDSVDEQLLEKPHRWDIGLIKKFMLIFGLVSSAFDYLTFAALIFILHATPAQFRTGWFLESVISATLIVLVIRTRKPFYKSKPGKYLLIATICILIFTVLIPFSPFLGLFGFEYLPVKFILILVLITLFYILTAELVKKIFYKKVIY